MDEGKYKVCRLCLSQNKLSNIFLVINKRLAVSPAELIKECLSIEVSEVDGLPPWVCIKCSTRISRFYSYKLNCQKTIESFKTCVNVEQEPLVKIERLENDLSLDFILGEELDVSKAEIGELEIKTEDNVEFNIVDDDVGQNDDYETTAELKEEDKTVNFKEELSTEDQGILLQRLTETKAKICPLCSKKYITHKSLISHVRSFHFNIKYYCDICDLYVSSEEKHKQLHLQSKWSKCDKCEAEFLTKKMYIEHVLKQHNNGEFVCDCGRGFKFLETLEEHKVSDHNKIYACYFCPTLYSRKHKLVGHMDSHLSGKVLRRRAIKSECTKMSIDDIPKVTGGNCPLCKWKSSRARVLEHIKSTHLGYKYFCDICKKYYACEIRHVNTKHSKPNWTSCKKCDQSFKLKREYLIHMRKMHKIVERKYNCHCGQSFTRLPKYNRHKYEVHKESPFMCEFCSKGYLRKSRLECHVIAVHTEVKVRKYKCPICVKAFYTYNNLRNHKLTHKQTEDFFCDHCGRAFKLKKLLRAHITRHDPLFKPHACMVCGKRFRRTDHRNIHQRTVHSIAQAKNDNL